MLKRKRVSTVAAELIAARNGNIPFCLLLGAGASVSSGVKSWESFAADILEVLDVDDDSGTSIQALEQHLNDTPTSRDLVSSSVEQVLSSAVPSRGYRFLAEIVRQGFYSTIITTNWDSLLETALSQVLRADEFVVLNRDHAPDHYLAEALRNAGDRRLVVLKLHGDPKSRLRMGEGLSTRSIPRELLDALGDRLRKVHIVGHSVSDKDVLQLLMRSIANSEITAVTPKASGLDGQISAVADAYVGGETSLAELRYGRRKGPAAETESPTKVNVGEFDHFFCQTALALERKLLAQQGERFREVESALLKKEETGVRYINYSKITSLTRTFVGAILADGKPDIVFFVNDPSAPGGMEVKKRIEEALASEGIRVGVIRVEGTPDNRSFQRQFRGPDAPDVGETDGRVLSVHVVDSITFSGNTLQIARQQVQRWYPHAEVRIGALVVSQMLVDRAVGDPAMDIYSAAVTDRFEIFFPWGVTQTTGSFNRRFMGLDGERLVHIARRPWGAIEVLVDEEPCSVRLLTIEANKRLSFQRHLCRDELFVALDDNIGLDLSVADLSIGDDAFHPSVKSMVLEKGDYVLIPRGIWHRTKASMDRVRLLEVGFGVYDQQYDIERLADDFDRVTADGAE
jgi:mannose-6-phosphate isomerase-like protein (cupin superfamily)/hypoxanthine phosphoribosyltransferase